MITKIVKVESDAHIVEAAEIIKNGGLVAFPTETVYGLGADGLDSECVKKIYKAKGRPSDNPLILHIAAMENLERLACSINSDALKLADRFWPGPMTLILKKRDTVPYETSGGLDTVAVRFPKHKTAKRLIELSGVPIAAPSANSSGRPSPTKATHVEYDLNGKIEMILDDGVCELGLESTVIDMTADIPVILRPGFITKEMIEAVTSKVEVSVNASDGAPKAPGMKYTHYSPNAKVTLVSGEIDKMVNTIKSLSQSNTTDRIGILATEQTKEMYSKGIILTVGDRRKPETIGANLFKLLRRFDYLGVTHVYAEAFDETGLGAAVMNRLSKASSDFIKV